MPLAWGEERWLQTFYFAIKTLAEKYVLVGECEPHHNSKSLASETHAVSWLFFF